MAAVCIAQWRQCALHSGGGVHCAMTAVCIAQWRQCVLHSGGCVHCTVAAVCIAQLRQYALGHCSNAETSVPQQWQHFACWTGSEYSNAVVMHDGGIDGALHRSPFFVIFGDFLPLAPWQFSPRRQLYNPRKISSSLQVDGQKALPPPPPSCLCHPAVNYRFAKHVSWIGPDSTN